MAPTCEKNVQIKLTPKVNIILWPAKANSKTSSCDMLWLRDIYNKNQKSPGKSVKFLKKKVPDLFCTL
jgi:hypothetical protein